MLWALAKVGVPAERMQSLAAQAALQHADSMWLRDMARLMWAMVMLGAGAGGERVDVRHGHDAQGRKCGEGGRFWLNVGGWV